MNKKMLTKAVGGATLAVLLLALILSYAALKTIGEEKEEFNPVQPSKEFIPSVLDVLEKQDEITQQLLNELNQGKYSPSSPYVVLNPYGTAPLSALALFQTEQPCTVTVTVYGTSIDTNMEFTFSEPSVYHQIPIYGLMANTVNTVQLKTTDNMGISTNYNIDVVTDELPAYLSNYTIQATTFAENQYQHGLNFELSNYNCAFDKAGNIRWILNNLPQQSRGFIDNESIYFALGSYHSGDAVIAQLDFLGRFKNVYYSPYGIHHDISAIGNQIYFSGSDKETVEDIVGIIDTDSGVLTKVLDYKDILQRSRTYGSFWDDSDWIHINSIEESNGDVIVSSNHQSTVVKTDLEGKIKWMLAEEKKYFSKFNPYFLKPIDEDFEYPYNQHDVTVMPDNDGNSDTVDILIFDNGTSRNYVNDELQRQIKVGEIVEPQLYSRLVQYRINEKDMTIEQVWQYGKERPELFSSSCGSAQLLNNGNILGGFDTMEYYEYAYEQAPRDTSDVIVEVNSDGDLIWEMFITSTLTSNNAHSYRIQRAEIYSAHTASFDLNSKCNNLIPSEVLARYA